MLRTVTTPMPSAIDSRGPCPGIGKNATTMMASSTTPAKVAVRPAVFAIEAACLGAWPSARLERKRVTISSE